MTDRDKLIYLIINADTYDSYECKLCTKDGACDCCFAEKLADRILADGWIRPPCEIEDEVWIVQKYPWKDPEILRGKVSQLMQKSDKTWKIRISTEKSFRYITVDQFGKDVFFSLEEAEKDIKKVW